MGIAARIVFVAGTDTGVGKTVLTAYLLHHLRALGVNALAMKPCCSGGSQDVELIQALQGYALPAKVVNPYSFPEAVAPMVAARKHRRRVRLDVLLRQIRRVSAMADWLIIEGIGGLLVPLGPGLFVADLIRRLPCRVIVVARDRLGTINHSLLTVMTLKSLGHRDIKVVLMGQEDPDQSTLTNHEVLRDLLCPMEVFRLPYLGRDALRVEAAKKNWGKVKKVLARLLA